MIVAAQIFASPLRYDENWNLEPYLAKSWEVAEDGLSVTLNLEEEAVFHDGTPITSSDVAFSIRTVQEYHPFSTMFAPVTTIDTPDEHTVIIHMSQPHPAILMAMSPAFLPILPEHIYGDGQDIQTHPANLAPVGSGPFKFVSFEPNQRIILDRFEDFFIPNRPYLDRIEFWIDTDPASQLMLLEREVAQMASPFTNLDQLSLLAQQGSDHLVVTQQGFEAVGGINWLAFNTLEEPLDNILVRQAIAYAIDKEFITDFLHQGLTNRQISPIIYHSPFFDPEIPSYPYDLGKAASLLDQAGYPLKEDGTRFSLTLDYIPILPSQQHDVAYFIQNQLQDVGIEIQIRDSADFSEWVDRVGNWDFQLTMDAVFNWGDPVIGVHRTYLSDNIRQGVIWSNTQNYSNPEVDQILSFAAQEIDPVRREELYSQFQYIVAEELPVLWINSLPFHTIYHTGLGNLPLTIWGVHSPMDEVYWQTPVEMDYLPIPEIPSDFDDPLVEAGIQAIRLLQTEDFYTGRDMITSFINEISDLDETGLHVVGITQSGKIFLDSSGTLSAGMDISSLKDQDGELILPILLRTSEDLNATATVLINGWPHPIEKTFQTATIWCGQLRDQEIICSIYWN